MLLALGRLVDGLVAGLVAGLVISKKIDVDDELRVKHQAILQYSTQVYL